MSWPPRELARMPLCCVYATRVADAVIALQAWVMSNFTRADTENFAGPHTEIARAEP
jgi:hypothetical protein